ncbi:T6SS effector BTH_I2691 family protein [Achromobacter kerstersii]|uniref:T6SS effector BTH_I2691 family protein n=1 Tax=Achromobacter kerstersii TaxID=1353890 RepID=UPI00313B1A51
MTLSQQLIDIVEETMPLPPGSCNACERYGVPILLLRPAVVAKNSFLRARGALSHPGLQESLRILRMGYVYVLLDRRVWHAYQVTDAGHMRHFNPYEMPRAEPAPLAERCVQAAHNLPASFIGIDIDKYKVAWIAYSQDPWPTSVLDAYKSGKGLNADYPQRFVIVDLPKLREDPTAGGTALGLEHTHLLHEHVAEYASGVDDFGSVHGWSSRVAQAAGMRNYLTLMERQHRLPQGVSGLILPDPVGLAEELNNVRLAAYTQKRLWSEEPERRYAYLTSQCLLAIQQLYAVQADAETLDSSTPLLDIMPSESGTPPVFWDPARERQERVQDKITDRVERLKERYWETNPPTEPRRHGRASFQARYDRDIKRFEHDIDAYGKDWAQVIGSAAWKRIVAMDYSDTDERSRQLRLITVGACLDGGITDAMPASDPASNEPETLGPTGTAWQGLLSDPNSAAYLALNGHQTFLQTTFLPIFGAGAVANDAGKKYFDAVKSIISSKEIGAWREGRAADAADQLLTAMHGASKRLHQHLSAGAKSAVDAVHVGGTWLYRKAQMTQVVIQLTVGELLSICAEELQRVGESLQQDASRRVRAFVFAGLISIPDPAVRNTLIDVTLWVEGSAEDVHKRINALKTVAGNQVESAARHVEGVVRQAEDAARKVSNGAMRKISAGMKNLEAPAAQLLKGLELSAAHAQEFAKNGLTSLKRLSVGSGYGALSLVSLYFLHDSVRTSLEAARETVGARHPEAMAALYGAGVGLLGAGVEAGGLTLRIGAESVQPFMRRVAAVEGGAVARAIGMGKTLIKAGGVIAALGGVADGVGSFAAVIRAKEAGDAKAKNAYIFGGALAIGGAGFGAYGAATSGALFGPLGIGIVLALAAFFTTSLAKRHESDAMENWARRCYFGINILDRRWAAPEQMDSAISALNAAVLGMDASLGFHSAKRPMDVDALMTTDIHVIKETGGFESGNELGYRIFLPGFDSVRSCFELSLSVERFGVAKGGRRTPVITSSVLDSVHHNSARAALRLGEAQSTDPQSMILPSNESPVLSRRYWLEPMHAIKVATLEISYWPDRDDAAGYARLCISEDA